MCSSDLLPSPCVLLFLFVLGLSLCLPSWGVTFVTFPSSWDVGQGFAVSITSTAEYKDPSVTWLGRTVSLDVEPGGEGRISYGLLGSYVRNVKPGEHPLVFAFTQNGQRIEATGSVRLLPRKYPEEHLKVSPKMVFPSKVDQPRIKREAALAAAAKRTMTVKRFWSTPPQYPIRSVVTSSYGFRRVYNGTPRSPHAGTDFRAAAIMREAIKISRLKLLVDFVTVVLFILLAIIVDAMKSEIVTIPDIHVI